MRQVKSVGGNKSCFPFPVRLTELDEKKACKVLQMERKSAVYWTHESRFRSLPGALRVSSNMQAYVMQTGINYG